MLISRIKGYVDYVLILNYFVINYTLLWCCTATSQPDRVIYIWVSKNIILFHVIITFNLKGRFVTITQRKIHCRQEWKWRSFESHFAFCVTHRFVYGINSRTFFSSTYSTRRGELLIPFCNGNLTQNSSALGMKMAIVWVPFCVLCYATVWLRE